MTVWPSPCMVGITMWDVHLSVAFPFFLLRTLSLLSPKLCHAKLKEEEESRAGAGKIKPHHDLVFETVA